MNRAPPVGEGPASTSPAVRSCDRLDDRQPQAGARVAGDGRRGRTRERSARRSGSPFRREARAVVGDLEHGVAVPALDGHLDLAPVGRVAKAVVEQVERRAGGARPRSPSRAPGPCLADRQPMAVRDRPHLGDGGRCDLREVAPRAATPVRPASARASSRRSETRRLMRREERRARADHLARPRRPRSRARVAPGAARGWRGCSSAACAARATRRRRTRAAACIICSVSDRAASSSRSIWSSVRASSPTSSSRLGLGDPVRGVARGGDHAGGGGQRGDRAHGAAGDRDAGERGEDGAADDAQREEEPQPVDRASRGSSVLRAYWTRSADQTRASGSPVSGDREVAYVAHALGVGCPKVGSVRRLRSRHRGRPRGRPGRRRCDQRQRSRCGAAEWRAPVRRVELECVFSAGS